MHMAMALPQPPPPQSKKKHGQLRAVTVLSFLLGFALLLPYAIHTARPLPAVGLAPMFASAVAAIAIYQHKLQSLKTIACVDLLLATSLFAVLMPRYATSMLLILFLTEQSANSFPHSWILMPIKSASIGRGLLMLGTYGTVPLMINL